MSRVVKTTALAAVAIAIGWCVGALSMIGYAAWSLAHGVNP